MDVISSSLHPLPFVLSTIHTPSLPPFLHPLQRRQRRLLYLRPSFLPSLLLLLLLLLLLHYHGWASWTMEDLFPSRAPYPGTHLLFGLFSW